MLPDHLEYWDQLRGHRPALFRALALFPDLASQAMAHEVRRLAVPESPQPRLQPKTRLKKPLNLRTLATGEAPPRLLRDYQAAHQQRQT